MQAAKARVTPEICAEIRGHCLRVPSKKNSEEDQPEQRRNLRRSEYVLDESARLHTENIDDREHNHNQDVYEVLRIQPNIHPAEIHRAHRKLRDFPQTDNPTTTKDSPPKNPPEFPKPAPPA